MTAQLASPTAYLVTNTGGEPSLCFPEDRGDYGDENHSPVFAPLYLVAQLASPSEPEDLHRFALDYRTAIRPDEVVAAWHRLEAYVAALRQPEAQPVEASDDARKLNILATFAHEVYMGAIQRTELEHSARRALMRAGLLNLESVVALAEPSPVAQPVGSDAWQPIETAPADQFLLLAAQFKGPGDWRIKMGEFQTKPCDYGWRLLGASWEPTHWMPLPAPPSLAQAEASGQAPSVEGART